MSPVELGVELRARRVKAGLTQRDLAQLLATTQPAVARIEAGTVVPSALLVDRWVGATGYPITLGTGTNPMTLEQKGRLVREVVGDDAFDPWARLEAKRLRGMNVEPERRYLASVTPKPNARKKASRRG